MAFTIDIIFSVPMLSRIEIWGARFTSIFSIMTGWIAEMFYMLFFAYIAV